MPIRDEIAHVAWRVSSASANGSGTCVEAGPLADLTGRVAVRHSRRPDGNVLVYPRHAWHSFLCDLKTGALDRRD